MPNESSSALNVIAIALSIQTLLMVAGCVAAVIAWRRVTAEADRRMAVLSERLDEVVRETRTAAQAVTRVSDRADGLLGGTQGIVRTLVGAVAPPKALMVASAASVASKFLSRWRRTRTRVA